MGQKRRTRPVDRVTLNDVAEQLEAIASVEAEAYEQMLEGLSTQRRQAQQADSDFRKAEVSIRKARQIAEQKNQDLAAIVEILRGHVER